MNIIHAMENTKQIDSQYQRMTQTPVSKLILSLGLPTVISMLVTSIYNMADTYFVGTLGTSASGATGIVFGLMAILQAFGFMFGHGAGANIARKLGNHDVQSAKEYASTSFWCSILIGVLIMIFGLLFIDPFMRLLGSTSTILPYARTYGIYILIAGAGLSTAISQYISMFVLIIPYLRGRTQSSFHLKDFSTRRIVYQDIISTGMPSLFRQGLNSVSTMVLNGTAGIYGDAAVAAISIVTRIINFMFCIAIGIGQGFQPVSAFNYGAKYYSRVKQGFFFAMKLGTLIMIILSIFSFFNASSLVSIFRDDPEVIKIGVRTLHWYSISLILMPITMYGNMLFQSIGKAKVASFLAALRSGLSLIPCIVILNACFGLNGLETAQSISEIIASIITLPFIIHFFQKMPEDHKD